MNPRWIEEMGWRMGEVYGAVTDQILINLARHFPYIAQGKIPSGGWDYQVRKLAELGQVTRETEEIILQNMKGADASLAGLLEETIRKSLEKVDPELRKAAEKGLLNGSAQTMTAPSMTQTFKAFYTQSADKLNLVNTTMLESTQDVYRKTVSDIASRMEQAQGALNIAAGETVSGVSTLNKAVRGAVQKMVDNGISGFIDNGGHRWSPEAYVTMDIRTTLANTARAAVTEEMHEYGCDTFSVSWHDGARPLCYPWQGKVISESGWTGDVEDLDGNKVHVYALSETSYGEPAGLFGINCGHYKIPFIPGLSIARQPEQNEGENAKEYAESQQQRQLERNLRAEKRDYEVLKAQGAPEEELKAQRERVRNARNDLDTFCDETGRSRRSGRESTPIDAKWPTDNGEVRRFNGRYVGTDQPLHVEPITPVTPVTPVTPGVPSSPAQAVSSAVPTSVPDPSIVTFPNEPAKADIITKDLAGRGIRTVDLTPWDHVPTEQEIISSIAGADQTSGSCASVALAYAGNKGGYQVHDFRGGASMDFFATKANTEAIAKIPGIDGICITNAREIKTANELLAKMVPGKEYWLGTGRHAAIVRCDPSGVGYQYLELQSAYRNGWFTLNDSTLRYRFGCVKRRGVALSNRLMEVDKLIQSPDFGEALRFINTEVGMQKKGAGGGIK